MEITDNLLKDIYCEDYFKGNEYLDYLSDKETIQKNYLNRLGKIRCNSIEANALEIGCAYGFFGELFVKKFKNATYTGMDVVSEAIEFGRETLGLNLQLQDYLTFSTVEKYTHVFMWDVIEHLERPDLFIEKISRDILTGGELHITTGDINSLLARLQKRNWRMIHPPSHLHYFSKDTISLLLNRYGFKIKDVSYQPTYRCIKQIFFSLFLLRKPYSHNKQKMFKLIPEKWFIPLNTFDIMYIIAEKK